MRKTIARPLPAWVLGTEPRSPAGIQALHGWAISPALGDLFCTLDIPEVIYYCGLVAQIIEEHFRIKVISLFSKDFIGIALSRQILIIKCFFTLNVGIILTDLEWMSIAAIFFITINDSFLIQERETILQPPSSTINRAEEDYHRVLPAFFFKYDFAGKSTCQTMLWCWHSSMDEIWR